MSFHPQCLTRYLIEDLFLYTLSPLSIISIKIAARKCLLLMETVEENNKNDCFNY